MQGYNRVTLIGNLARSPDIKTTTTGKSVANFTLACNTGYGRGEERRESTEFARCVAWEKTAEVVFKYSAKGDPLFVEGRMQTRSYDKNGTKIYTTEVVVDRVILLKRKGEGSSEAGEGSLPFDDDFEAPAPEPDVQEDLLF